MCIVEALSETKNTVRQAASLSSLAISDDELHEDDNDGRYQELLLRERYRFLHLLTQECVVRVIICPDAQIERIELGLVDDVYIRRNILPRYDQLISVIRENMHNQNLHVICTLRLPHDNLVIIDDKVVFIGRKRRRDRGFPYTTQLFDPTVIKDEIGEFDAVFHDNVGPLLGLDRIDDSNYGSAELKEILLKKLNKSKSRIQHLLRYKNPGSQHSPDGASVDDRSH